MRNTRTRGVLAFPRGVGHGPTARRAVHWQVFGLVGAQGVNPLPWREATVSFTGASQVVVPVRMPVSFPLTAAGQSRISTGFPLSPPAEAGGPAPPP